MKRLNTVRGGDGELHTAEEVLSPAELAEYLGWIQPRPERVVVDPGMVALVAALQAVAR